MGEKDRHVGIDPFIKKISVFSLLLLLLFTGLVCVLLPLPCCDPSNVLLCALRAAGIH